MLGVFRWSVMKHKHLEDFLFFIDHCFVSKNILPKIKRTYIDRKITASDHWPLWMEMDTEKNN